MDSSELLAGRPCGRGILYRKSLSQSISRLRCCSKHFCALTLTLTNPITNSTFNTLLINVYLPTDYNTCDSNNAFLETVAELDGFISSQSYDNIIICGDFNVDFSCGGHNFHLFMCEHGLVSADRKSSIKYTYRRDDHTSFSRPDHILTLSYHLHLISGITCSESVDNFSDHLPLFFNLVINDPTSPPNLDSRSNSGTNYVSKYLVDWIKVTEADTNKYCDFIRDHIPVLSDSLLACCDPKCSRHSAELDTACSQLLECMELGARVCLPEVCSRRTVVPGWNQHAHPLREAARFWHQLWCV